MKEEIGNLWEFEADARCITTNGSVRSDGKAVMGRGCASQARVRYPGLDSYLGLMLGEKRNVPVILLRDLDVGGYLVSFPVKIVWYQKADLFIIDRSARLLMRMIKGQKWQRVILPRPGVGNGGLKWETVKPVIEHILDDRVVVVTDEP
jgi:hypothetical protein